MKVVGVAEKLPRNYFDVTLNNNEIKKIEHDPASDYYEFFLPGVIQVKGINTIGISIKPEIKKRFPHLAKIILHSIVLTHGAAVRTTANIGDEIRPAIVLASPISVKYPFPSETAKILKFDYGMIPGNSSMDTSSYRVTISILNKHQTPVWTHRFKLKSNRKIQGWRRKRIQIPPVSGEKKSILIGFSPVDDHVEARDYLALSEMFILSKTQKLLPVSEKRKPNILFVTLSGIGVNSLSPYGYPAAHTPVMDRLFQHGESYINTFSASNNASASILSMLTGRYPISSGFFNRQDSEPVDSLAAMLLQSGYHSAVLGYKQNWERLAFQKISGLQRIYLHGIQWFEDTAFVSKWNEVLDSCKDKPVFFSIQLNYPIPQVGKNLPLYSKKDYGNRRLSTKSLNLPMNDIQRIEHLLDKSSDIRSLFAQYDSYISGIDRILGKSLLGILSKYPKRDLILVITSDRGVYRTPDSNIFSSDSLSDEVLHIPFLICSFSEGRLTSRSILHPEPLSAIRICDLVESTALSTKEENRNPSEMLFSEHGSRRIVAVRKGKWKMIYCFTEPYFRIANKNLFNLDSDPMEKLNLFSRNPKIGDSLVNAILEFTEDSPAYPKPSPGIFEEANEILKSLHYTE